MCFLRVPQEVRVAPRTPARQRFAPEGAEHGDCARECAQDFEFISGGGVDQRPISAFLVTIKGQGGEHRDNQVVHIKEHPDGFKGVPPRNHALRCKHVRCQGRCLPTPAHLYKVDCLRGTRLADIGGWCNQG